MLRKRQHQMTTIDRRQFFTQEHDGLDKPSRDRWTVESIGGIHPMAELIKVSAQSRSTAVAGAIAGVMREQGYAEVQAIGASAVNQAVKAVAIARGYLEQDNMDLVIVPSFTEVDIEGNERTAVRLAIFKRPDALEATNGA
jgi:stage V sporulation protein S